MQAMPTNLEIPTPNGDEEEDPGADAPTHPSNAPVFRLDPWLTHYVSDESEEIIRREAAKHPRRRWRPVPCPLTPRCQKDEGHVGPCWTIEQEDRVTGSEEEFFARIPPAPPTGPMHYYQEDGVEMPCPCHLCERWREHNR